MMEALTQPLIAEQVWQSLTGTEFCDHADVLLGPLATMGERLAMNDNDLENNNNDWIQWHKYHPSEHQRSLRDGAELVSAI